MREKDPDLEDNIMDLLLNECLNSKQNIDCMDTVLRRVKQKKKIKRNITLLSAIIASIILSFCIGLIMQKEKPTSQKQQVIRLSKNWLVDAKSDANYSIISATHIKLHSGEIRVKSKNETKESFKIETDKSISVSNHGEFLIACHHLNNDKGNENMKLMKMTRLLVLAGSITTSAFAKDIALKKNEVAVIKGDEIKKIVQKSNNDFAFNFFKEINKDNTENTFFSPYSMINAFAMATEGARGNTALEMGKALSFPDDLMRKGKNAVDMPWEMMKLHTNLSELNKLINNDPDSDEIKKLKVSIKKQKEDAQKLSDYKKHQALKKIELEEQKIKSYKFSLVNDMWIDENFKVEEDYVNKINQMHSTNIRPAFFSTKPEEMRQQINKQVFDNTFEKISDLLPERSITQDTALVLSNAIYFKGDWLKSFNKNYTSKRDFDTFEGMKKVDMMYARKSQTSKYAAFDTNGKPIRINRGTSANFEVLEMPYRGKDLSMVVILPSSKEKLKNLEAELNSTNLNHWISSLRKQKVNILLPKFKVESAIKKQKMREILENLGMKDAFSTKANFGGIDKSKRIFISSVYHKAFIEVNEVGTEATAATAIVFDKKSAGPYIPTFNANRPFIYLIKDNHSNTILFMGRLTNP